jgi:membrane-associated phospholipid phosphatase
MFQFNRVILLLVAVILPFFSYSQQPLLDSTDKEIMTNTGIASAFLFTGAFAMDKPFIDFVRSGQNRLLDQYTHHANYLGSKKVILPLSAAVYAGGLALGDKTLQNTSFNAFKSILTASSVTISLKYLTGRSRPYVREGAYAFDPFPQDKHEYRSLPSGHSTLAFAFFTPFAERYSRWLYAIPFSVGLSRIYKDDHWTSDVVLGSAIGFLAGYFFEHKNRHIEFSLNGIVVKF